MPRLRLFAAAREAANRSGDFIEAATLAELLEAACARYGEQFATVLARSKVWVNGDEPVEHASTALSPADEVAVLPPVSGGSWEFQEHE